MRQRSVNPDLNLEAFSYALSDYCGRGNLDISRGGSRSRIAETGHLKVECRTLDFLINEGGFPPPQVIKMDIEGHEPKAIRGALNSLHRYKPIVLCDYNTGVGPSVVEALLKPLGYKVASGPPIIALPEIDS